RSAACRGAVSRTNSPVIKSTGPRSNRNNGRTPHASLPYLFFQHWRTRLSAARLPCSQEQFRPAPQSQRRRALRSDGGLVRVHIPASSRLRDSARLGDGLDQDGGGAGSVVAVGGVDGGEVMIAARRELELEGRHAAAVKSASAQDGGAVVEGHRTGWDP